MPNVAVSFNRSCTFYSFFFLSFFLWDVYSMFRLATSIPKNKSKILDIKYLHQISFHLAYFIHFVPLRICFSFNQFASLRTWLNTKLHVATKSLFSSITPHVQASVSQIGPFNSCWMSLTQILATHNRKVFSHSRALLSSQHHCRWLKGVKGDSDLADF